MWSISCAFRSSGRSTTSSTPHSSPHIRRRKNTDQTTTTPPRTSSKANRSGKWSRLREPDASDDLDDSNTGSGGRDTPTRTTLGKLRMTYTLRSLLRTSGKEIERWPRNWHINPRPTKGRKPTPSPYHSCRPMSQTTPVNTTLVPTTAESQVMRSLLTPLRTMMEEATPTHTWTEDEIFLNIALPLLTHLRPSIAEIVAVPSLWSEMRTTIQLECVTDGQWRRMGDYAVLMVRFGIRDALVTGMRLVRSMRMEHWGPLHTCVMQLIPRATLLCTGFFDERESYTANLSRLWPAPNWPLHVRATSTGSTGDLPYAPSSTQN